MKNDEKISTEKANEKIKNAVLLICASATQSARNVLPTLKNDCKKNDLPVPNV